jgi:hypothetical protein
MTGVEIDPATHPKKVVRDALKDLVKQGWTLRAEGHWGKLYCSCLDGGCTTIPVSGTPKAPERHARDIMTRARRCPLPTEDPRRSLTGLKRSSETQEDC